MSLTILHLADLHLGTTTYERWEAGRPNRLYEFLHLLDKALELGDAEGVDLVIAAGDIYHCLRPEPLVQREWATRVARLRATGTPVVIVPGNHDLPSRAPAVTSQAVFSALALPNVHVAAEPRIIKIQTRHGRVAVAAVPWPGAAGKHLSLADLFGTEGTRALGWGSYAVLAGHLWLRGGKTSSEGPLFADEEMLVDPAAIAHEAFNYYALGHLHVHQTLFMPAGGPAVYAGSLNRLDFADEGVPKGVVLVTVGDETRVNFVGLPAREFITLEIRAADHQSLRRQLAAAASSVNVTDAIIRVRVFVPEGLPTHVASRDVAQTLTGAWHVKTIIEVERRQPRRRRAEISPSDDVAAALAAFARAVPPPAGVTLEEVAARANALQKTISP